MRYLAKLSLLCLVAIAAGCGGGGSSSTSGTHALGVFATDSFNDDYDHVWVTIYKVEVVNTAGTPQTVFEDPAGRSVDLKTLRDAAGARFLFLNNALLRSGTHARIRVTIGSSLVIFPRGSTTGQDTPVADSVPRDSQGHAVIEFPLATLRNLGSGNDDLVVDFDLAHFALAGDKVVPACKEGDKAGLPDHHRHEQDAYKGTVSGLAGAAPSFSFTLTTHSGMAFAVVTDANTTLFNSDASPNPALANGKRVAVEGTFDVAANRLTAAEIKIKVETTDPDDARPEVEGAASQANAAAGTFVVATTDVEGFLPTQTTVHVATTAGTVFRSDGGLLLTAADFFAKLTAGEEVQVQGTYDAATNTLTAARVKLDHKGDATGEHEAEILGTATDVNAAAGTFKLTSLSEWEGLLPPSTPISVATNGETVFKDASGNVLTSAAFFAALGSGPQVKVEGVFSAGTLTAAKLKLAL